MLLLRIQLTVTCLQITNPSSSFIRRDSDSPMFTSNIWQEAANFWARVFVRLWLDQNPKLIRLFAYFTNLSIALGELLCISSVNYKRRKVSLKHSVHFIVDRMELDKTRMHSSRMRTGRSSSRPGGLHQPPPGAGTPPGPDPPGSRHPALWTESQMPVKI